MPQQKPSQQICIICGANKLGRWYSKNSKPTCPTCYNKAREANFVCCTCGINKSVRWHSLNGNTACYLCFRRDNDLFNFASSKNRAKSRKLEWDITFELYQQLRSLLCYYCDRKLNKSGVGLDRKDNSLGYLSNNVVPCCKECNRIKGDSLTCEEMLEVAVTIKRLRSKCV